MSHPYVICTNGAIPGVGNRVVGDRVVGLAVGVELGEGVGDGVVGMASSHIIETPAATVLWSDVKRTSMLPDVAVWIGGMAVPLNSPKSVLVAETPSLTYT